MKSYLKIFIICSIPTTLWAQATVGHYRELIDVARQPSVPIKQKELAAQRVLDFLREDFNKEFKTEKTADLYRKIIENPEKLKSLTTSNGKYVDLFTDFSRLVSQISVENTLSSCENYKTYKESMVEGNASYSPCAEGNFSQSFILYDSKKSGELSTASYSVPNFAYSSNVSDLIKVNNSLVLEKNAPENLPLVLGMQELTKESSTKDLQDTYFLHKKMVFQDEIYNRSILNAARNVVSLKLQYSDKELTEKELDQKITSTVESLCAHCNPKTQMNMGRRLAHVLQDEKKKGALKHRPTSEVAKSLCEKLRENKYPFYQSYGAKNLSLPSMIAGRTKVLTDAYRLARVKALTAVVQGGNDGLLILTDSVTKLDDEVTDYLKLKCNGSAEDNQMLRGAAEEAAAKAGEYAKKLNAEIQTGSAPSTIEKNIQFMLRSNPRAFGEALNQSTAMAPHACDLLASIKNQDRRDELEEKALIWGTAVVGTGLTLTGAFAPLGSALTMSALAAGTAVGAAGAVYEYQTAQEAKDKSELFEAATFASGDGKLIVISQAEYKKYQAAKISAMVNLGLSAVDVATLSKRFLGQKKTFVELAGLLSAKAETKALTPTERVILKFGDEASTDLEKFLKVTHPADVSTALETLKKDPANFQRDGRWDLNTFKLEVLNPGSAAKKFKRMSEWKYVGNKQPFRVPEFKAGVSPTKIEVDLREAYVAARDVLDTPDVVYKQMQAFEDEVIVECHKMNPKYARLPIDQQFEIKQTAMEKVLGAQELKHGFKSTSVTEYKPLILEKKPYSLDEWFEMLQQGHMFNDSGFLPSTTDNLATKLMEVNERAGHGYYTHRIQFYVLMKEMDKNPAKFNNVKASQLLTTLGDMKFNKKLGLANGPGDTLWQEIFDSFSGSYHQPEFFRQRHDDYPELGPWMMIETREFRKI